MTTTMIDPTGKAILARLGEEQREKDRAARRKAALAELKKARARVETELPPMIKASQEAEKKANAAKLASDKATAEYCDARRNLAAVGSSLQGAAEHLADEIRRLAPDAVDKWRGELRRMYGETHAMQYERVPEVKYEAGIREQVVTDPKYPPAKVKARLDAITAAIECIPDIGLLPDDKIDQAIADARKSIPTI